LADDLERVMDYFPRLRERAHQQAGTLSGGEQQMLAIGRALMGRPRLLLLDEPSFGLAPLVVQDIFAIMRRINQEQGVSILLVEQNASLALDIAHSACVLETGRIILSGTAAQLRQNDAVRQAYLGA
jgi:branched-chain amino acid transport system ATP-binding protein